MRTLHFCWEYPPNGSGAGKYIAEIAAGLRSLGHFTVVVTSRRRDLPEEEQLEGGVIYRIYDLQEIGLPHVAQKVLDLARRHRVDLIEGIEHLGEAAELLKLRRRPPVLINCRYNDVVYGARYAQAWYFWQHLTITLACLRDGRRLQRERYSIEHADLLAAPSAWMLNALRNQGLRLSSSAAVLPKPLASLSQWTNVEAEVPTLLLVGRIDVGKGVLYLRALLTHLVPQFPNLRVEVAGDDTYARFIGSMRAWTQRHLGEQRDRVRFLGPLSPSALDEAYRRAWVVMVPSRWDTSPTVLLEAMVRSKPVVVSPYGGMSEYVGTAGGRVEDPGSPSFAEAIAAFLSDRAYRVKVGEALRQRAEQEYNPGYAAQQYVDFVQRALAIE